MITKELIRRGIETNNVRFIVDPNMGKGTVCQIGDGWFYFGGFTAEELSPDEYSMYFVEDIAQEVLEALDDFRKCDELKDEYSYYELFLKENVV